MEPTSSVIPGAPAAGLPDHTQLPDKDGSIVTNFQEHPQSNLLTGSLFPRLCELYPDGQFCIGHDCGIYWRHMRQPLEGCKAPDWFFVSGVPPMLDGQPRRSYVLWQEGVHPLAVIEYVSGDGSEERDTTPHRGKFWVYEQGICAPYYAIYEAEKGTVELFKLIAGRYQQVEPNAAGRLPIEPLRVELGIWQGTYRGMELPWLRVWDAVSGQMLPSEEERAEAERHKVEFQRKRADTAESLLDDTRQMLSEETERAENERKRAEQLAERLRAAGIDPDAA
jgi:Uma2 family endonuclease